MPKNQGRPRSKSARPAPDRAPASPATQTLGSRLRIARNACRLYLSDIAEKLDISKQAVGHWESDRTEPTIANLRALARIYGVKLDWLINGGEGLLPPEFVQGSKETAVAAEQQLIMMIRAFQAAGLHNINAWIDAEGIPRVEATDKEDNHVPRR